MYNNCFFFFRKEKLGFQKETKISEGRTLHQKIFK